MSRGVFFGFLVAVLFMRVGWAQTPNCNTAVSPKSVYDVIRELAEKTAENEKLKAQAIGETSVDNKKRRILVRDGQNRMLGVGILVSEDIHSNTICYVAEGLGVDNSTINYFAGYDYSRGSFAEYKQVEQDMAWAPGQLICHVPKSKISFAADKNVNIKIKDGLGVEHKVKLGDWICGTKSKMPSRIVDIFEDGTILIISSVLRTPDELKSTDLKFVQGLSATSPLEKCD